MSRSVPFPRDPAQEVHVPRATLQELFSKMLAKKSVFQYDAITILDRMFEADLRGLPAYGCARIVDILQAIDLGDIDPRGRVLTVSETPALAVLNGSRAAGAVAATKGMELAVKKAREVGVGTVAVGNSQPAGAASVYAMLACREGMIGYCITSTGKASVTSPAGGSPVVGNLAISWAIPTGEGSAPLVFDTACGESSWGKLAWLKKYGLPVPAEILSRESAQPEDSLSAPMLPAGGAFGFGMSLVGSLLAGPLCGGKTPLHKKRTNTSEDSQHFLQALDISQFAETEKFFKEVNSTLEELRQVPDVRIPGDRAAGLDSSSEMILFHHADAEAIRKQAMKMKLEVTF